MPIDARDAARDAWCDSRSTSSLVSVVTIVDGDPGLADHAG